MTDATFGHYSTAESKVVSHSNLGAFWFVQFMLAIRLKCPDRGRGLTNLMDYYTNANFEKKIKKITRYKCDTIYDLNGTGHVAKAFRGQEKCFKNSFHSAFYCVINF